MSERHYWFWMFPVPHDRHLTPARRNEVLQEVGERRGVTLKELLSDSRTRRVAHARQHAMFLLRAEGYSTPEIGRAFGKHHTTVLHATESHVQRAGVAA